MLEATVGEVDNADGRRSGSSVLHPPMLVLLIPFLELAFLCRHNADTRPTQANAGASVTMVQMTAADQAIVKAIP